MAEGQSLGPVRPHSLINLENEEPEPGAAVDLLPQAIHHLFSEDPSATCLQSCASIEYMTPLPGKGHVISGWLPGGGKVVTASS